MNQHMYYSIKTPDCQFVMYTLEMATYENTFINLLQFNKKQLTSDRKL